MNFGYSIVIYLVLCILLCKIGSGLSIFCFNRTKSEHFKVEFRISRYSIINQLYTLDSNADLRDFNFSPTLPTAILVHGFLSSHECEKFIDMRNAFLTWKDMNVITVNCNEGCNKIVDYAQAVGNTQSTALKIKEFILRLISSFNHTTPINEWGHFHFVGHSLGAHVAGQAAAHLKKSNVTIHRITGLDPALPCFKDHRLNLRLNTSNARFVDVIHTNGGRYGIFEPMGHVDFYVNGGKKQPGCSCRIDRATRILPCHHNRAVLYFTQSILQELENECTFLGQPWNMESDKEYDKSCPIDTCQHKICLPMGIKAQEVKSGVKNVYVSVIKSTPYCNNC